MRHAWLDSPIGPLLLLADTAGLREIRFPAGGGPAPAPERSREDSAALRAPLRALAAYFRGRPVSDVGPLVPEVTPFQREVLDALARVPFGKTRTYGELARCVGRPRASRAVGMALGRNPLPIVLPCHRVVGANGRLTGFGGGIERKRWLLEHEARHAARRTAPGRAG